MDKKPLAVAALTICIVLGLASCASPADDGALRADAQAAMRRAAAFYRMRVASHGGYVYYYYSLDLARRWGEGAAGPDEVWVQPPGTPTVGLAYLKAFEATGDRFYLGAAREAGEALVYGQLRSCGWTSSIDFDPRGPRVALYRNGKGRGKNHSTLDDGTSQEAIRLLMHLDQALGFAHEPIHASARVALDALLEAQFPSGGFPQVWSGPVSRRPIVRASFPDGDWRGAHKIRNYWEMYTLNDNVAGNVASALRDAYHIYKDQRYRQAMARLGDFLILARMPEPQPAWAQQYDYDMRPIWARKFEPPAITGRESQDAIATLIEIYHDTGDEKYLEPIPRALDYLKRSLLADGQLARYYELKTNRPLYMRRKDDTYSPTYDDANLPRHYGWKTASRLGELERQYNALRSGGPRVTKANPGADRLQQVSRAIRDLDEQGRWVSTYDGEMIVGQPKFRPGDRYISSEVFSRNLETLSDYLIETK